MTQRPTFTVITANYNSGDKLIATVASVRAQSVDAEHLIVDGASTDHSLALARQLADAGTPGQVRVISERDRGVYDAMNKGIRAATGRYLYFLGAGDVVRPGALAAVQTLLPAHDGALVYGDAWYYGRVYDGVFDYHKIARKNVCHQAAFYGRDVFARVGEYDLKYKAWADWELNLRCFGKRGVATQYVPVLVADFEPDGISLAGDTAFSADHRELVRRHFGLRRYWNTWLVRGIAKVGRMTGLAAKPVD